MPTVEYVAAKQLLFDADRENYGDFQKTLADIKQRMNPARPGDDAASGSPHAQARS
jgi:hypothetical protein